MPDSYVRNDRSVKDVHDFWNQASCGTRTWNPALDDVEKYSQEYFDIINSTRYNGHDYLGEIGIFQRWKGKRVLEVGCGAGIDGAEFAYNGAEYFGVDLTEEAVKNTKEFFAIRNLKGSISLDNAEALSFEKDYFDCVYSFGVIHHTPDIERAVSEIYRVLKPNGSCFIMVYNKWSINYFYDIIFVHGLLKGRLFSQSIEQLIDSLTDKSNCPISRVFSRKNAFELFHRHNFKEIKTSVWYFREGHIPIIKRVLSLDNNKYLGRVAGWHLVIEAKK